MKLTLKKANLASEMPELLETIQNNLFAKASGELARKKVVAELWPDFNAALEKGSLIVAPFCGRPSCEEQIKEKSKANVEVEPGTPSRGAKSLCFPFQQPASVEGKKCFNSCLPAVKYCMFSRSY